MGGVIPLPLSPVALTAGRLHLRPWEPGDAAAVHAICQDPLVQQWTQVPVPYALIDAQSYVGSVSPGGWAAGTDAHFAVLDSVSAAVLASVSLMRIEERRAEIGYWCAAPARGQGVTAQAVSAVCRWAFAALDLVRVEWLADTGNPASRRVAEKAGFTLEGVLRARLRRRDGTPADAWVGSLLPGDRS